MSLNGIVFWPTILLRLRGVCWGVILTVVLPAVSLLPMATEASALEPIPVKWDGNAELWYYGAMNQNGASRRLSRYSAENDLGGEFGEAFRRFSYVVSDSFFTMMGDGESVLLTFFINPNGRYYSFPADRTLLLRRGDDVWRVDRIFVIYYWIQNDHLVPRIDALGGSHDVYLQLNAEINPDELRLHDGWKKFVGRLHSLRNDDEMSLFALMSPTSDKGNRWNNQDRTTPIEALIVSTTLKEARHEGSLYSRSGDGNPALASDAQPEHK